MFTSAISTIITPLLHASANCLAIGLTPNATRMDIIKYTTLFVFGAIAIFFLLIRLTIIPFLVKNYYSLADATNIGLSLFILYSLNLFTLLFWGYSDSTGWRVLFFVMLVFWLIHLLLKVILSQRQTD
jgi:hypothetical protein